MAYTKHNYQSKSKLYASQLNEMEDQIAKNEQDISTLQNSTGPCIIENPDDPNEGVIVDSIYSGSGGGSVDVDKTLTLENYAADAKTVGDEIAGIKNAIGGTVEEYKYTRVGTKAIGGYVGWSGDYFDNTYYENIVVECVEGDRFRVTTKCVDSLVLAVYYNGEPSAATWMDSFSGSLEELTEYHDEIVIIPEGCTYVAFNGQRYDDNFIVEKIMVSEKYNGMMKEIKDTNKKVDDVIGRSIEHSSYVAVDATREIGGYSVNTRDYFGLDSANYVLLPCVEGDEFSVSSVCNGGFVLALYFSDTPSPSTYLGSYTNGLSDYVTYENEHVTIPEGCKYVVFNSYRIGKPSPIVRKKQTWIEYEEGLFSSVQAEVATISDPFCEYKFDSDGGLLLRWHYTEDLDAVIRLDCGRGNGLFDFSRFGTIDKEIKTSALTTDELNLVWSSGTDWHAPFQISALDNIDGDDATNVTFTGGNHQYNNSGSGSTHTASSKYVRFFADGKPVTSGYGHMRRFVIEWKNGVQAQNTRKVDGSGREVLEEVHTMEFDGRRFNETVRLTALERIKIILWYGFQFSSRLTVYPNVLYIGGKNRTINTADSSNSGNNKPSGIHAYGSEHCIDTWIDTDYDLGKREAYSGTSGAFTSNGKAYYNTLYNLAVEAGETYCMRGGYMFTPVFQE